MRERVLAALRLKPATNNEHGPGAPGDAAAGDEGIQRGIRTMIRFVTISIVLVSQAPSIGGSDCP